MKNVDQEVRQLFDSDPAGWLSSTRYNRRNLEDWFTSWHEFCARGKRYITWATIVADVEHAVGQLKPVYRDLHTLYNVLGYSQEETEIIFGWDHSGKRFNYCWDRLVGKTLAILKDRRIMQVSTVREPQPVPDTLYDWHGPAIERRR